MNTSVEIVPAGSVKTASFQVPFRNNQGKYCTLVMDITSAGTGSVTVTIMGKDKTTGKTWVILASAALVAAATTVYKVGPGMTAAGNLVANDTLPKDLLIDFTHNNANPMTYGCGLQITE